MEENKIDMAQVDLSKLSEREVQYLKEKGVLRKEAMPGLGEHGEEHGRKKGHGHHGGRAIMAFLRILAFILVVGGIGAGGYMVYKQWSEKQITIIQTTLSEEILKVAELSTSKIYYTRLLHIEDNRKVMNPTYTLEYDGVIRIGIDDVNNIKIIFGEEGKVNVVLPHTEVLENALLDQRKSDKKEYMFSYVKTEDIMQGIKESMAEYQKQIVESGILVQADQQLQEIATTILNGFGYVDITYMWESK